MKISKTLLLAALVAGLTIGFSDRAKAQSIWTNPITGTNPSSTNPYTTGQTVNANITVSGIGRGTGTAANAANDRYNLNSWNTTSLDPTAYFTFTLDANPGFEIDFTSFVYTGQASGSFASPQLALRSSLDSFGSNIGSPTSSGATISLSAGTYQNLTAPIEFRLYVWNASAATATYSVNDFTFNGTVSAAVTGNNTAIAASTTNVALGRVMQTASDPTNNVTLNKTGTDTTTYTVVAGGQATLAGNGTSFAGGTQSDQISVGVNRTTTGAKTGTVTVDNTAASSGGANQGSADPNDVINVSGTVVADRVISGESVNLGKVLVGTTTASQDSTLSTIGADIDRTRVTVNGSAASNGGVTVAAGTGQLFNEATDSVDRSVSGNFSTSGSKNVNVNLSVTGEGLVGEAVNNVTVNATADVYQAAALTVNNSNPLDLATVTVTNAATSDGGQRAAARIISNTVSGDGWDVSGLDVGTVIGQNSSAMGATSFDETGKLNGTHLGSLVLGFEHDDQTIQGTAAGDLGTASWNLSHLVENNEASTGTAEIRTGNSYAGFNLTNNDGRATNAELLAGSASGDTEVTISFDGLASGSYAALNDASRVSDVVSLEGTGGDIIVLQLTYDDTGLGSAESDLRLMWFDGTEWVLAVEGNSIGTPQFVLGGYTNQAIGSYGIDTDSNTVWAVIDHNSDFAVVNAVPEPGAATLLATVGVALVVFRRRMRA